MITSKAIRDFNKELNFFGKTLVPRELTKLVKVIAFSAFARIVFKTPVDTGRARGNWQITIGAPSFDLIGDADALDAALASFGDESAQAQAVLKDLKPFEIVFINNNVSYIEFLEDCTSDQAPEGMVVETFEELIQIFPNRGGSNATIN